MENMNSYSPINLRGCSDYVYMDFTGTSRYVISEDRLEYPPALQEERNKPRFDVVTTDRLYLLSHTDNEDTANTLTVEAYDSITGAPLPEKNFVTDLPYDEYENSVRILPYQEMLVIAAGDRVVFYDIGGDKYGTKLGEIGLEYEEAKIFSQFFQRPFDIKLTNGKLYLICNPTDYDAYMDPNAVRQGSYLLYQVYSCPVEDILKGQGTWKKEFEFQPK